VLAIFVHKLSYAARDSTPIIVVRTASLSATYSFNGSTHRRLPRPSGATTEMFRVIDYVRGLLAAGKKVGKTELEDHTTEKVGFGTQNAT